MAASVKKFSTAPKYLVKDYFDMLMEARGTKRSSDPIDVYDAVRFDSSHSLGWSNAGSLDFEGMYDRTEAIQNNSLLIGPRTTIIAQGGQWTTMYAKVDDYGFKDVKVKPNDDWDAEEGWFNLDVDLTPKMSPGLWDTATVSPSAVPNSEGTSVEDVTEKRFALVKHVERGPSELPPSMIESLPISASGPTHAFKVYLQGEDYEAPKIDPGTELYMRKDSFFHEWFTKELKTLGTDIASPLNSKSAASDSRFFEWDHESFFNDKALFAYFGGAWHSNGEGSAVRMQHRTLKDFAYDSFPESATTDNDNLNTFVKELYDRVHHEAYASLQNVDTMNDPEEIPAKFIGYLAKFYGSDLDKYQLDEDTQREYVKQLIYFLKKKGTYNDLQSRWKSLVMTTNRLTISERWHAPNEDVPVFAPDISTIEED